MQCVGRAAELPITRAKSLSSAVSQNSANVAVSSEQSPERWHRRMDASVSFGCMSESNPCARAVSLTRMIADIVETFCIHSMCSQCLQLMNC